MIKNSLFLLISLLVFSACSDKQINLVITDPAHPRLEYGAEKLSGALEAAGYEVITSSDGQVPKEGTSILIGLLSDDRISAALAEAGQEATADPGKEGFSIASANGLTVIGGADHSGALYGCMELAGIVKKKERLPEGIRITEAPEMVLRGTCIGLQKTTYLPGRHVYEYPYTPENFPWFYDKELWIKYLDMMVENRYNSLYLWNGHPFASLVKLEDYPYAIEVDDETFKKNEEMFSFLTQEANKRGIWVIQMFYNIIVSKPFAEKHNIKTQDRSRPIIPMIADYTRKSIAAFVEKYPNVGLLVALGEAMSGIDTDVEWFTKTIIPGVQDGLRALGKTEEPPIVLRAHDTDAPTVMEAALPLYKNLYTMNKYNGESLTTNRPRGPWAELHRKLSSLGSTHIDNVHILSNLEPFRYGSPDFIQKSIKAMHKAHGANGLHLYPQTSYWDWPYTPDNTEPRLLEMERDWIWYKAWGRYAWDAEHDRESEVNYWSGLLSEKYGCEDCGTDILKAYEESGEISPMLLRRFGITEGNRQTMTLGMFMSQLVSPNKYSVAEMVYNSHGPEGEKLTVYAEKEFKGEEHVGETPQQAIEDVVEYAMRAVAAIEAAAHDVSKNKEEFARLKNDMYCYQALANFYAEKVRAAMFVLRYGYSKDMEDLEKAIPHLEKSIEHYTRMVALTEDTYLYANSMQTKQRRIPIGGNDGKNKTWKELLVFYKDELDNFKQNIELLKSTSGADQMNVGETLIPQDVDFLSDHEGTYTFKVGARPFSESQYVIEGFAEELKNLKGIKYSFEDLDDNETEVRFKTDKPVKMVVGFFQSDKTEFLSPPTLEVDASANDYGQADIRILNAMKISGLPPLNVHTYSFEPGEHSLLFDNDVFMILGFMDRNQEIRQRDAGYAAEGSATGLDWLFY